MWLDQTAAVEVGTKKHNENGDNTPAVSTVEHTVGFTVTGGVPESTMYLLTGMVTR